jgi:hypothetical protein
MMNIAWTFTTAIVIFAAQRYGPGVEPMCSSPYLPECVEGVFSEVRIASVQQLQNLKRGLWDSGTTELQTD